MKRLFGFLKRVTLDTLVAPAEDPRRVFATPDQRRQELLTKVRSVRGRIADSRRQMDTRVAELRSKLVSQKNQWDTEFNEDEKLARYAQDLRKVADEELAELGDQVRELKQEERVLSLLEQRLVTQMEAMQARQAGSSRTQEEGILGDVTDELARFGLEVTSAENRADRVQARASAIDRLAEIGIIDDSGSNIGTTTIHKQADQCAPPEFGTLRRVLQKELSKRKWADGAKSMNLLVYEYVQLHKVLERKKETDCLSVAQVPRLAEETYRQGLSVLSDAVELMRATRSSDKERLEADIVELEEEITSLKRGIPQTDRANMLQERLDSQRERLEMIKRQRARAEELLHQCGRCEASLHRCRIEMVALKVEGSQTSVGAVIETLEETIKRARDVQEEMKRLGL
jgi:hypothetical protein